MKKFYCYHVWRNYKPMCLNGSPLYEFDVVSFKPIKTRGDLSEAVKFSTDEISQMIYFQNTDRKYIVVPMSTLTYFYNKISTYFYYMYIEPFFDRHPRVFNFLYPIDQ